jgi:hypothetical protein
MRINLKSLIRAALQVGGTLAASGIVTGHAGTTLENVVGVGSILTGVIWGQMNAYKHGSI